MFSAALRDLAGAYFSDRLLKIISVFHLVLVSVITILYAHSWYEGLVVISSFLSTLAAIFRDDFYKFRFLLMGRQLAMFSFNIWVQSFSGILHLGFVMVSNIFGIYRYNRARKLLSQHRQEPDTLTF